MYPPADSVKFIVADAEVIGIFESVPESRVKNITILKHRGLFNADLYYDTLKEILSDYNVIDIAFVSFKECISRSSVFEDCVLKEHYETV